MGNGFLFSVSSVQSPLNGSTAFADQKLLRLDPILRPLLQLLDGFHTIQFSWRFIISQWRFFFFGPKQSSYFFYFIRQPTLLRGVRGNVQPPVLLFTRAWRECFDKPAEQQMGAFSVRGNGGKAQHRF